MNIVSTLLFMLLAVASYAQPKIQISQPIDIDYRSGYTKAMLHENGNTFLLHRHDKEPLAVMVYNTERKLFAQSSVANELDLCAVLKTKQEVLLFFDGKELKGGLNWVLRRVRLDAANGKVLADDRICDRVCAVSDEEWHRPKFIVEKDAVTDEYLVVIEDRGATVELGKKIEAVHYDEQHREISAGYCVPDDETVKDYRVVVAAVDGVRRVFVVTCEQRKNLRKEGTVYINRLNSGDTVASRAIVGEAEYYEKAFGRAIYNATTGSIELLLRNKVLFDAAVIGDDGSYYRSAFFKVNASSLETITATSIFEESGDGKRVIPQQMHLNKDNSIVVLYEQVKAKQLDIIVPKVIATTFGEFGVLAINAAGALSGSYSVAKSKVVYGVGIAPDYMVQQEKGAQYSAANLAPDLAAYFAHINAGDKDYVVYNDEKEHQPRYCKLYDGVTDCKPLIDIGSDALHDKVCMVVTGDVQDGVFVSLFIDYIKDARASNRKKKAPSSMLVWAGFE